MYPTIYYLQDNQLVRTLFNNFPSQLVFIFYSQANPKSQQYLYKIKKLLSTFGRSERTKYYSLSAEKCPYIFKKFNVEVVPTSIITQTDKKIIARFDNEITAAELLEQISQHYYNFINNFERYKKKWHPKIQSILSACPVIIFIKGTPDYPKCGFTEQLLEIMKNYGIEYTYYDIIADEYMRYWLRHYGGWPTYPQIFMDGKLIGGLDVLKELIAKKYLNVKNYMKSSSPEEKIKQLREENKVTLLLDGFPFYKPGNEKAYNDLKEKYQPEEIKIVNVALDNTLKQYMEKQHGLPFVIEK